MARAPKSNPLTRPDRKQAVIYARVSSKEQEKEGFSIPAQLKLLKEYAAVQGFAVSKEYVDMETAKQTGRAAFGEMVAYLKAHPSVRVMLVEKDRPALSQPQGLGDSGRTGRLSCAVAHAASAPDRDCKSQLKRG